MGPKRSKLDWALEAVALLAVLATVALAAMSYTRIQQRGPRAPGPEQMEPPRTQAAPKDPIPVPLGEEEQEFPRQGWNGPRGGRGRGGGFGRGSFGPPVRAELLPARTTLWLIALIDVLAYAGLTLASRGRGVFDIPEHMDREAPHVRQMLFSMVIVMKTVLALFGVYLVWSLVNVALGRGPGISGVFLTIFTLAVPVPLVFYTLRLRRYSSNK